MLDEISQSGLSPLEVIEYDNQRPIPCDGFQFRARNLGCVVLTDVHGLTDSGGQRPEGDAVPVRQAMPSDSSCPLAHKRDEFLHKPGFTDSSLAQDREELAGMVGDSAFERLKEHGLLLVSPDHGGVKVGSRVS